jgi:hypothetical protein
VFFFSCDYIFCHVSSPAPIQIHIDCPAARAKQNQPDDNDHRQHHSARRLMKEFFQHYFWFQESLPLKGVHLGYS